MVLTDRDPLALRCALRSARQSGLHSLAPRPLRLAHAHLCPQQARMAEDDDWMRHYLASRGEAELGGHADRRLCCR